MGAIYEIESGGHDLEIVIERTVELQEISASSSGFFTDSVRMAWVNHETTDKIIEELAEGWRLERIAKVDLAILRLAIVELLVGLEDPPPPDPVVINEAVVLAKKFSTADSGKFVNGILASVVKNKEKYQSMMAPENPAEL